MGSRSAARTAKNTSKQNERIDIEGLESFFLDDHKELLAKGLNLKEAVYYYGDTKNEIREKIRNGQIPAIRIPDADGPKWCIFPDGVPSALKHLIPSSEESDQQQNPEPETSKQKPIKKIETKAPSEKNIETEARKAKNKVKTKQPTSGQRQAEEPSTLPAVSQQKALKKAEPAPKNAINTVPASLTATASEIVPVSKPEITGPANYKAQTSLIDATSANGQPTEITTPAGLLISARAAFGLTDSLFMSNNRSSFLHTDLSSRVDTQPVAVQGSAQLVESNSIVSIMDKFNLPFVDSDWPPASFVPTKSLANINFDPASIESEAASAVTHSFIISDATSNSFSLPLGSILEALIPTLEFKAPLLSESPEDFAQAVKKQPPAIIIEGNIADFGPTRLAETSIIPTIQQVSEAPATAFTAFAAIRLDHQPAIDQMLHQLEQAAINSIDDSTASYNPFVIGSEWLPQIEINAATDSTEHDDETPVVALEAPLVFVSEDTALPTIPSVRPVNREEASRNRAGAEQLDFAPKFERVADLIQKVNELEKELREVHYKNNYLEARLTGMEDQLKYLSQNDHSTKPWNTYTIIILGLLTALALIIFRLIA